jgi:hypothetical protein
MLGLDWRLGASKVLCAEDRSPREGGDPWRDSSWRKTLRGKILRGERGFVERLSVERSALRKEVSRINSLHGDNSQREMIFKERISL